MAQKKIKKIKSKKSEITLEDLAIIIQQGFEEARNENEKRFVKLEQGQAKLEQGQAKLEQGQAKLEQGQEEIKLRMCNVAYRIDIIDLQKRLQKVEDIVLKKKK